MNPHPFATFALCLTSALAQDQALFDAGEYVQVTTTTAIVTEAAKDIPGLERLLDRISIERSGDTSPASYIVAGRIISGNSASPLERIPILIGLKEKEPVLAGLTNADGEFRFRLWIKEDDRELEIQTTTDFDGFLYVGAGGDSPFFGESILLSGGPRVAIANYRRYPLKRLVELSPIPKK
jgi:hypothetical protein